MRTPLVLLTPGQVEGAGRDGVQDGYSTPSILIAQTLSTLRRAIRRAQRDGKVSRNVAELVDAPPQARGRGHGR